MKTVPTDIMESLRVRLFELNLILGELEKTAGLEAELQIVSHIYNSSLKPYIRYLDKPFTVVRCSPSGEALSRQQERGVIVTPTPYTDEKLNDWFLVLTRTQIEIWRKYPSQEYDAYRIAELMSGAQDVNERSTEWKPFRVADVVSGIDNILQEVSSKMIERSEKLKSLRQIFEKAKSTLAEQKAGEA